MCRARRPASLSPAMPSAPKIDFTSSPSFPRDQVLAMLLFVSMTPQLTTSQMASLATALARIAGGSVVLTPLTKIRGLLGLDRLAVGGGPAWRMAGRALKPGNISQRCLCRGEAGDTGLRHAGPGSVDLTKHLKLNTTVGTGDRSPASPRRRNDPGSSMGLSIRAGLLIKRCHDAAWDNPIRAGLEGLYEARIRRVRLGNPGFSLRLCAPERTWRAASHMLRAASSTSTNQT